MESRDEDELRKKARVYLNGTLTRWTEGDLDELVSLLRDAKNPRAQVLPTRDVLKERALDYLSAHGHLIRFLSKPRDVEELTQLLVRLVEEVYSVNEVQVAVNADLVEKNRELRAALKKQVALCDCEGKGAIEDLEHGDHECRDPVCVLSRKLLA